MELVENSLVHLVISFSIAALLFQGQPLLTDTHASTPNLALASMSAHLPTLPPIHLSHSRKKNSPKATQEVFVHMRVTDWDDSSKRSKEDAEATHDVEAMCFHQEGQGQPVCR